MAKLSQPPKLSLLWQASLDDHVIALAWSPDGSRIAAASVSGPIHIYQATDGVLKYTLPGHGFGTTCLSWQPDGNLIASSGQDGKVRLWDGAKGTAAGILDADAPWAERVVWSPKGDYLVSAAGKKLRLWNDQGELVRSFADLPSTVADVKWAPKGKEFASIGFGGPCFWSPEADALLRQFSWKGSALVLAWSPDGKCLVGGAQDASVHFWYVKDGKDLEMSGYPRKVRELAWDSTSTYIASGGGQLVTVWDCSGKGPAGSKPISFALHEEPLSALAFQHKGVLLASACAGGKLALWYPGGETGALGSQDRRRHLADRLGPERQPHRDRR